MFLLHVVNIINLSGSHQLCFQKSHPDESSSSGEATMDIGNTLDSGATLDTTDGLDNNQNTVSRDDEEYNY